MSNTEHVRMMGLLEAMRALVSERERETLTPTLLHTMQSLLPEQSLRFVAAPEAGDETERDPLAAEWLDHLMQWPLSQAAEAPAIVGENYSLHAVVSARQVQGVVIATRRTASGEQPLEIIYALLRIYREFATVIDDAHRDTLTGLLNRRTFEQRIQALLLQARNAPPEVDGPDRRQTHEADQAWLAVLDIDHFKRINDGFGHLYGDEVLILMSRLTQQCMRKSDLVFRFGGEEFAVLLSPCSQHGARTALERLRSTVAAHAFPQVGQVTVSIGFAPVRAQDMPASVVAHADEALYAAKRQGRNQVQQYVPAALAQPEAASAVELF